MRYSIIVLLASACNNDVGAPDGASCELAPTGETVAVDTVSTLGFSVADAIDAAAGAVTVEFVEPGAASGSTRTLTASFVPMGEGFVAELVGPDRCARAPRLVVDVDAELRAEDGWFEAQGPATLYAAASTASEIEIEGALDLAPSVGLDNEVEAYVASFCETPDEALRLSLGEGGASWADSRGTIVVDACGGATSDVLYRTDVLAP